VGSAGFQYLKAGKKESTVHGEGLAGNVRTFFRSQQEGKFGNVRGLP
jgi:hypothetical protein